MTADLVLWQWSLLAQLVSGAMIAGFFLAFSKAFQTPEVRAWTLSWLANLGSLIITVIDVYWVDATSGVAYAIVCAVYIFTKGWFVALMLEGLRLAIHDGRAGEPSHVPAIAIGVAASLGALLQPGLSLLSLIVQGAIGLGIGLGLWTVLQHFRQPVGWLTLGLALRAALGLTEGAAYASEAVPSLITLPWASSVLSQLLAVSSSFDMMTEWLLALGCVLAATDRAHRELQGTNDELRKAQRALRALVNVDPLTGLASRRALPAIMRDVQPHGAALVFFDLRGFKTINDVGGHQAGDEALRRFAAAVRESFRPEDAVVRYGGDEFLVVARSLTREGMVARVEALRARLSADRDGLGVIEFDAGHAELAPGGIPEEAIRSADLAMYQAKDIAHGSSALARVSS